MKKRVVWYLVASLIVGLALLAISCGGATQAPAEEPKAEEPKVEEPVVPPTPQPTTTPPIAGPPAIPHTLEGRADCLICHQAGGLKPYPADHAGRTSDMCQACHKPA